MKSPIILLAFAAAALTSCSTAYKTGQTPDDVYYSPARVQEEYVRAEDKRDDNYYRGDEDFYTDRYIRMRIQNRYQWSVLDDYYFNNPYAYNSYGFYGNWSSPWNSYWAWNTYCNPYYYGPVIIVKNPGYYVAPPSRAVAFNPRSYINIPPPATSRQAASIKGIGGSFYSSGNVNSGSSRYNNSNSSRSNNYNSSNGNNSYRPSNNSTPSRSYTPSSSGSSSSGRSSSSSSGSSSSSRPPR